MNKEEIMEIYEELIKSNPSQTTWIDRLKGKALENGKVLSDADCIFILNTMISLKGRK